MTMEMPIKAEPIDDSKDSKKRLLEPEGSGPSKKRGRAEPKKAAVKAPKVKATKLDGTGEGTEVVDAEAEAAPVKGPQFIVATTVRNFVKETYGMSTSSAFLGRLNGAVGDMLNAAHKRTECNKRKTIMPPDL
jgi:hypothetical protein